MRTINEIILHCSATKEGKHFDAEDIRVWHVNGNGWSDIGYHFVILLDGTIEHGRPVEKVGAHVKGRNRNSIGVCYIGGLDEDGKPKDTMTKEQEASFLDVVHSLRLVLGGNISVSGHNEYANKACPSFVLCKKFPNL